jgi:glycine/D-amino acid oxidase-like deaminating enzyme
MKHSGHSSSVWIPTTPRPGFQPLDRDLTTDVVIVGAGIAGLTTAYHLAREGRAVVLLDSGPVFSGESERTTAHLASAMDDRFTELERLHGPEGARLAFESHAAAINRIEEIVGLEKIHCGFTRLDGYLFAPPHGSRELLETELAAAHRAGFATAELMARAPLPDFNTGPAIRFPHQGQFHPLQYLAALAEAIVSRGGAIHTHSHVVDIAGGDPARVRTAAGRTVTATSVVVTTNSPVNDRVVMQTKQVPYRTYAIGAAIDRGVIPTALYWDTADPYHYVRLTAGEGDRDLLVVGGEDHRTGDDDGKTDRYARLERWTRERFPIGDIQFRWSGQVLEPVDALGFIGRNPSDHDNVFIATGDSGQGMTHGTLAGMILPDLIADRPNPWADLYDPARQSGLRDVGEFARDGAAIARHYAKWLSPGEVASDTDIPPGHGAIVRDGLMKHALYRDDEGRLHECSAVCPHLGGIVSWNKAEQSWDCPVHGSRFDRFGKVINGPAKSDLPPVRESARPTRT